MSNQTWNNFRVGLPLFLRNDFIIAVLFIFMPLVPTTIFACLVFGILLPQPPIPFSSLWWDAMYAFLLWTALAVVMDVFAAKRIVEIGREAVTGNETGNKHTTTYTYLDDPQDLDLGYAVGMIQRSCHSAAEKAGWWTDIHTGEPIIRRPHVVGEKLMLIVSEVAEAMEGYRKNLNDDKLPHRKMIEVELADALIRICDLAGAMDLDLAGAVVEKMVFNRTREDHQIENRRKEGGKSF